MPHCNAYFKQNSDIIIKVYSSDAGKSANNGTVSKVEFYNGTTKLGESASATNNTYSFTWKCVPAGKYTIKAVSTNSKNVSFTSAGVIIQVGSKDVTSHGMSANKGKYLANIIAGSANSDYNTLWNGVSAENGCKWGSVEGSQDQMNWGSADVSYDHAKNNNLMFRYHAIAWGSQYPEWIKTLNTTDFKAEMEEYMAAVAARYEYMDQIDVLNEQIGTHAEGTGYFRNGLGGTGATGYDWQIWLFTKAREYFPNSKLVLNDYGLENDQNAIRQMLGLVQALRDRGLIDGFGTQAHCFNVDATSASGLKAALDLMDDGGVPIYVTELDLNGGVTDANNQSQQKSSYQTHFPIYWEHPSVAGITLWGYVDGQTWKTGTGILTSSRQDKQAMTWLKSYMSGQTDVSYPFGTIAGSCCATPSPSVQETSYLYKIGDQATQLSATGNALTWYGPDGTTLSSAPTPSTDTEGVFIYSVTETGSCESSPTNITVTVYAPQSPYGGTAMVIPGKIEFEYFDEGGQDSAYYDSSPGTSASPAPDFRTDEDVDIEICSDDGDGYNLGYTISGEWLEYTVDVKSAGTYSIDLRVACEGSGRTISLQSNGVAIATDISIPDTKGWQKWQTITVDDVELSAGRQIITLTIGSENYVNLNYMTFSLSSTPPSVTITSPANNSEFTTNDEIAISATALATDATIADVTFYANDKLLDTDNSAPYAYQWSGFEAGTYEIKAVATDSKGATTYETVQVTIAEAPATITLSAGWNLVGYPIEGSAEVSVALSSIWNEVETVKNNDGFFMKEYSSTFNSLQKLEWGQGYLVKVKNSCDLVWEKQ